MTLKTRLRRTDPTGAEPQPPMTLPDGHWIGFDYPGRIAPLTRREPTASGSSSASRGGWGASTNLRTTPGWRSSSACRAPRSRP